MPEVGSLPEKCKACSVALPLRNKCYRAFCEEKVEKMGSIMSAIRDDIAEEEARREEMLQRRGSDEIIPKKTEIKGDFLLVDSGDEFIKNLAVIAADDAEGLKRAQQSYGNSWKSRGGVGAFMMLARKWDRLENRVRKASALGGYYDIFAHIAADERSEGIIDDVRDLRRYLLLVEAEMMARGFNATHRDNQ